MNYQNTLSNVEKAILAQSAHALIYPPTEKVPVIEVENFPMLGKLTALRFLEWVQKHRGGVIALPTGKTPEYFIKYVKRYLAGWQSKKIQSELESYGIDPAIIPDMSSLHFIQIDEFYPIDPKQKNSFFYYVNKFYIEGFGLDPRKAMLMNFWEVGVPPGKTLKDVFPDGCVDLSLRHRHPVNEKEAMQKAAIEAVDQFCTDYESKIRSLGGIGFFLGGIGPDGHIAFNIRGSDHFSTTRLTATNYETQAAAATDLGGIEVSRNRLVVTIGLKTITHNPEVTAIIIAAGEAKAKVIAQAIENPKSNLYPASILQNLPNGRFYLTIGAASRLIERRFVDFKAKEELPFAEIERTIIDLAVSKKKRILDLNRKDLSSDRFGNELLRRFPDNYETLLHKVYESVDQKLKDGLEELDKKVFMHTAPHHDDIELGYLPYIYHLVRKPDNIHYFTYMTSGFTAVTNHYVLRMLEILQRQLHSSEMARLIDSGYFKRDQHTEDWDVYHYLDGVAANNRTILEEANCRRLLRILMEVLEEESPAHLSDRINELIGYFRTQYPGKKDLPHIQRLKGMIREWEADLFWAHFGFSSRSVKHFRLGFYQGEIFTEDPEFQRDVQPLVDFMKEITPDVVTLAFDPEGSGPDTHYKVMRAIAEAIKTYLSLGGKEPEIWGYRNVWYRFHPAEATTFVPVSINSMAVLNNAFNNAFGSQVDASFPSYELDGPFSKLVQKIWSEQFYAVKVCMGDDYFNENRHPRVRACHGLCFLKKMSVNEFLEQTMILKRRLEIGNE
ncbi:MAG: 6-phosphogluconolactonase [candidate division KSB1 bacterium]|nr:6-phosphogluconolactonase [candidate division KSB1 bacterium]